MSTEKSVSSSESSPDKARVLSPEHVKPDRFSALSPATLLEAWWDRAQPETSLILKSKDGETIVVPRKSIPKLLKLIKRGRS